VGIKQDPISKITKAKSAGGILGKAPKYKALELNSQYCQKRDI
jgi:hypothetical protein